VIRNSVGIKEAGKAWFVRPWIKYKSLTISNMRNILDCFFVLPGVRNHVKFSRFEFWNYDHAEIAQAGLWDAFGVFCPT
jgi:hypothetical protein